MTSSYFTKLNLIFVFKILDVSFAINSKLLLTLQYLYFVRGGRLEDRVRLARLMVISLSLTGKSILFFLINCLYVNVLCWFFPKQK